MLGVFPIHAQQDTSALTPSEPIVASDTTLSKSDSLTTHLIPKEENSSPYTHRYRTLNSSYQHIDSLIDVKDLEHFIVPNGDGFGLLPMSNFGNATQRLYFEGDTSHLSNFMMGEGERTFQHIKELPYFDVKSPVSDMQFISGFRRGQDFRMNFTQNLGDRWNYYGSYNRTNSLGDYQNNQVLRDDFQLTSQYLSKNKRFQVLGAFQFNRIKLTEYGGLGFIQDFTENLTPNRETVLTNLLIGTRSDMIRVGAFSRQQYSLFVNKNDFRVSLFHDAELQSKSFAFNSNDTAFFPESTYGNITNDSLRSRQWTQNIGIAFGKTDGAGRRRELRLYSFYHFHNFGSEVFTSYQEALGVGYDANFQNSKDWIAFSSKGAINVLGNLAGSMISGQLRLGKASQWHAKGNVLISGKSPHLFWQNYRSNFYNWVNTNLDPIRTQKLEVSGNYKNNFAIGYAVSNVQNWMYLDTASLPIQAGNAAQIQKIFLDYTFKLGAVSFRNRLQYQGVTGMGDYAYIRIPDLLYRGQIWLDYSILKNILKGQLGVDLTYFTSYEALDYNPALARFHLQDGESIGDFPYVHFFATAQLSRFEFFIRIENLTGGLFAYDYFAAPLYPLPDRFARFGFKWRFFN